MRDKIVLTIIVSAMLVLTILYCKEPEPVIADSTDLSKYDYFDLLFLKNENPQLQGDITSMCWGDPIIYVLVDKVIEGPLTYYIRDKNKEIIDHRTSDFSEDVFIEGYQVVLYKPSIDIMHIDVEPTSFENMCNKDDHDEMCISRTTFNNISYGTYIQGRGNSSWQGTNKQSFSLRFSRRTRLVNDWQDHKSYNLVSMTFDRTLLKGLMFNKLAEDMGFLYQPKMKLVVLIINSEYHGIYLLTTKMSVDSKRIALTPGEMLIRFDPPDTDDAIPYKSSTWISDDDSKPTFELLYPEYYSSEIRELAKSRVQSAISSIEDVTSSNYLNYIDLDNIARHYLIQEVSMNYDALSRSIYAYWRDDKLYYGPIWDMDLTLGETFEKYNMLWVYPKRLYVKHIGFYTALWHHPEFVEKVKNLYKSEVRGECYALLNYANNIKGLIAEDAEMNFRQYTQNSNIGAITYKGSDYITYTDSMLEFYKQRLEFLDKIFL